MKQAAMEPVTRSWIPRSCLIERGATIRSADDLEQAFAMTGAGADQLPLKFRDAGQHSGGAAAKSVSPTSRRARNR
jgi:hypothetical protein